MKRWGCVLLIVGSHLILIFILLGPQTCVELVLPDESFEDKDADFLISKLRSWRFHHRNRAVRYLEDKTDERERDKIIAALTDTLLNDSHEEVRVSAAEALKRLTPPASEAVPALEEALNLPKNDRGYPIIWYMVLDVLPLPQAAEEALDSIIGAQKCLTPSRNRVRHPSRAASPMARRRWMPSL